MMNSSESRSKEVYVAYCCGGRYLDTTPRNNADLIRRGSGCKYDFA